MVKCILFLFSLGDEWLESIPLEGNLGVLVDSMLSISQQCLSSALAAMRRNSILRCTKYSTASWSKMQPHFEYRLQLWAPWYKRGVKLFECIQRAAKLVKELEGMSYEERLKTFALCSLEKRRLSGAFIALYNFPRKGNDQGDFSLFSLVTNNRTWRNGTKLC